ncbi:ferritin-like domain-containing protein [Hymenobacter baengnokdamensis]|uniref:ferritin-like domain-containing protein n=1 Tax=Hymenobacter baengnokdamensis TaxID=2615203 RepID=UPI001247A5B5|nr:PA2169 family four-helix-bundle protein [Hymenobacter baengnokdamensis]
MKKNQPSANTAATPRPKHSVAQNSAGEMRGQRPATVKKTSTVGKIVGGALLAVGVALVARRRKSAPATDQGATLDELLYFVNDRIEGYQRAVAESHDAELRGYYKQLASQSQQFATDLNTYLTREGGKRETSTTLKGKLYRAWMDTKAIVTARDEKSILGSNIYGEEWALKAYQEALADRTLTGPLRQAVERQYALSQHTYDRLKKLKAKQG